MKRTFYILAFLLLSVKVFSDEFIRKDGSKLIVNDLLTSVIGKTGNIEKLASNLDSVEQKFLEDNESCSAKKIDLAVAIYMNQSKLVFEINIANDVNLDERFYESVNRLFYVKHDMPYKYFYAVSDWFYGEHKNSSYYGDLNKLDPLYVFNYKNSNGKIQFQGIVSTSYFGSRLIVPTLSVPVFFMTCGPYEIKVPAEDRYYSGFSFGSPYYNAIKSTYNTAYFVAYLFSDYKRLLSMPVPAGLDGSFKTDHDNIVRYIKSGNWNSLSPLIKKYRMDFSYPVDDDAQILTQLLRKDAPLSVYENFLGKEKFDYSNYLDLILESDANHISFFYTFLNDALKKTCITQLQQNAPDKFFDFLRIQKSDVRSMVLDGSIDLLTLAKTSIDNLIFSTKDLQTKDLLLLFPKIQDNPDKIRAVIANRTDNYSKFVDYYYLSFNQYLSGESITQKQKELDIPPTTFYLSTMYCNPKTVFQNLIEQNSAEANETLKYLFENDILTLIIKTKTIVAVKCGNMSFPLSNIRGWLSNGYISELFNDSVFSAAYDLFAGNMQVEKLFEGSDLDLQYPHCSFSLLFEDSTKFGKDNKTGEFIFGNLRKGKFENRDISFKDSKMNTLLHLAATNGNVKLSQDLLKQGIDASLKNSDGKTALDIAKENGNKKIQKLLEK